MAIGEIRGCSSLCCIPVLYLKESVFNLNVGMSRFSSSLTYERKIKTLSLSNEVMWNVSCFFGLMSLNDNHSSLKAHRLIIWFITALDFCEVWKENLFKRMNILHLENNHLNFFEHPDPSQLSSKCFYLRFDSPQFLSIQDNIY